MRILLIPFSGGVGLGPLTRCLAVAEEGEKRGHDVAFLCKPFFRNIVKRRGFKSFPAPDSIHLQRSFPKYRLADIAVEYGLMDVRYLQKAVQRELAVIRSFHPDIIFTETQFSINFSSAVSGVPWATAVSWTDSAQFRSPLYKTFSPHLRYLNQVNRFAADYNIAPFADLCDLAFTRAHIKIAPTSLELQPELLSFPGIHFVGSLLSQTLEAQPDKADIPINQSWPTIYVYMSPGDIPAHQWIQTLCATFQNQPYNVIIMLAPLQKIPLLPVISNIHFLGLSPARKYIRMSDVVITHGGGNTIIHALLLGIPLLVFPHEYAERDYNGRAIERLGAGLNLPTSAFTPKAIRGFVEKLIREKSFTISAQALGKNLRKLGGTKKTVNILETYCT